MCSFKVLVNETNWDIKIVISSLKNLSKLQRQENKSRIVFLINLHLQCSKFHAKRNFRVETGWRFEANGVPVSRVKIFKHFSIVGVLEGIFEND